MTNEEKASQFEHDGHDNGHGKDMVTIFVNDTAHQIHRGRQTVMMIKSAAGIPFADALYLMPDYELLDDNGSMVIKGEERFKSVPPSGTSS
ncbi:hypothetical protein [Paenibacillus ferrarius]|uniref:hypothetical protein n=1 Tax=Paenibacillus ferrarius TaxID=1469647 RepID=UPI003D2BFAE1